VYAFSQLGGNGPNWSSVAGGRFRAVCSWSEIPVLCSDPVLYRYVGGILLPSFPPIVNISLSRLSPSKWNTRVKELCYCIIPTFEGDKYLPSLGLSIDAVSSVFAAISESLRSSQNPDKKNNCHKRCQIPRTVNCKYSLLNINGVNVTYSSKLYKHK